jgi:hypothetical protein
LITPELAEFFASGIATIVGSCDERLRPDCMRAIGVRADAATGEVEVLLPVANAERTLANLRANGRIAVTFGRAVDHRSIQVKGRMLEIRDGVEADRELAEQFLRNLAADWVPGGIPPRITKSLTSWPAAVVRLAVEELFVQTPGPGAGAELAGGRRSGNGATA